MNRLVDFILNNLTQCHNSKKRDLKVLYIEVHYKRFIL